MQKSKHYVSYSDIEFLFQELHKTWDSLHVPAHHRETFSKHLNLIPPSTVAFTVAKEIDDLDSKSAPVQLTLSYIEKREYLIGKLVAFQGKTKNLNKDLEITELEAAYLIQKLRSVTVEVIKSIEKWKKQFFSFDCEFFWNQINYVEKIKHDLNGVRKLGRFKFMIRDPFFLDSDCERVCLKAKSIVKVSKKDLKVFKKMEKILNYGMSDLRNLKISKAEEIDQQYESVFDVKVGSKDEVEADSLPFVILIESLDVLVKEICEQVVLEVNEVGNDLNEVVSVRFK